MLKSSARKNQHLTASQITQTLYAGMIFALLAGLVSAPALASRSTERSERNELLQQATGASSSSDSSSSFSARVNYIFDQTPSPTRAYVDQTIPLNPPAAIIQENPQDALWKAELQKRKGNQENLKSKIESQQNQISELSKPADQKIRMDDESYQKQADDLYNQKMEEDMRKINALASRKNPEQKSPRSKNPGLRPSLANNPFYFPESAAAATFAENKTVIVSRLVQSGYTRLEAENIVMNSNSPEEVILNLMQNEGLEYGSAVDLVGFSADTNSESGK